MKYRNCYLCESVNLEVISEKAKFGLPITNVICKDCGLVFQNPVKDKNEIALFYKKENYIETHYSNNFEEMLENFKIIAEMQYDFITKHYELTKKGKLLDIGSGVGAILSVFNKKGFQVEGVEPDSTTADFIRKKLNHKIYEDLFDNINLRKKYDIITISHVIEHVIDPIEFLENVRKNVNDGGIVFIEAPDIQKIYPYHREWYEWFEDGHLYSFSLNTLRAILLKTNYEIITIQRDSVYEWGVLRAIIKPTNSTKTDADIDINEYNTTMKSIKKTVGNYAIRKKMKIFIMMSQFFKLLFKDRKTLVKEINTKIYKLRDKK